MAGHDFMDFKDGEGGSDACTDMTHPENNGLAECMATGEVFGLAKVRVSMLEAYRMHCTEVSLADFIVIAAEAVMIDRASKDKKSWLTKQFKRNFRFGRTTNIKDCDYVVGRLPDPEHDCSDVKRVFVDNMGLTVREAAALSGVHTLGRAIQKHSGYEGWWSDPKNSRKFNNDYFVSMLAKGWQQKRSVGGDPKKNMWIRSDVGRDKRDNHEMMLNSDMCLAYKHNGEDLNAKKHRCCAWLDPPLPDGGIPQAVIDNMPDKQLCGAPPLPPGNESRIVCCDTFKDPVNAADCGSPLTPTGIAVKDVFEFASDEDKWLASFVTAWKKATENGMDSKLKKLLPNEKRQRKKNRKGRR